MTDIKRPAYFVGQFLTADDFLAEQTYHLDQRRREHRVRSGPGVLDGGFLCESVTGAPGQIAVGAGSAIDALGRALVLLDRRTLDIAGLATGRYFVTLGYAELSLDEDRRQADQYQGHIRITERPAIELKPTLPTGNRIGLDLVVGAVVIAAGGGVSIEPDPPERQLSRQQIIGPALINDGRGGGSYAANNQHMAAGSLTIGSTARNFGGGSAGWNNNTAALLLETLDNTEIAVHDSGNRVASIAYYEGGSANRLTIGRDMGWGALALVALKGDVDIGGTGATRCPLRIPDKGIQIGVDSNDATRNFHLVADGAAGQRGLRLYKGNYGAGTHLLTVLGDGKVGIGSTEPQQNLSVAAGLNIDQANTNGSDLAHGLRFGSNSGEGIASRRTAGGNQFGLDLYAGGAARMSITNSGNLGLGTSAPENAEGWGRVLDILSAGTNKLSLRTPAIEGRVMAHESGWWNSAAGMILGTKTNHALSLATNAQSRLTITPSGNLSIGTTTPGNYRLMVSGGDTRIAAAGQEQGLFGLDKLVGLNDLRFFVDDTGTTEVMHLNAAGLTVYGKISGKGSFVVGMIIMWSGAIAQIPSGWALCDGTNGTPDLRGRFVVGYSTGDNDYGNMNGIGGAKERTLATANLPSHNHPASASLVAPTLRFDKVSGIGGTHGLAAASGGATMDVTTGLHTHTITVSNTGGGAAFDIRPPYFVLAYLIYRG